MTEITLRNITSFKAERITHVGVTFVRLEIKTDSFLEDKNSATFYLFFEGENNEVRCSKLVQAINQAMLQLVEPNHA